MQIEKLVKEIAAIKSPEEKQNEPTLNELRSIITMRENEIAQLKKEIFEMEKVMVQMESVLDIKLSNPQFSMKSGSQNINKVSFMIIKEKIEFGDDLKSVKEELINMIEERDSWKMQAEELNKILIKRESLEKEAFNQYKAIP